MTTPIKTGHKIMATPAITHGIRMPLKSDRVAIRMYCLGTGDCFVLKFMSGKARCFTVMIDCGSCKGGPAEFRPFLEDLAAYVNNTIDLLVITHEHNDHVNGFAKHPDIFEAMDIREAWFAWTENPDDPNGRAQELLKQRSHMRLALQNAIQAYKARHEQRELKARSNGHRTFEQLILNNSRAFLNGLNTLAEINLEGAAGGKSLPGMRIIKQLLKKKKTKVRYLDPGDILTLQQAPGIKFHVLGPPSKRDYIFKNGKPGVDTYDKHLALDESSLSVNAFLSLNNSVRNDVPFAVDYLVNGDDTQSIYEDARNEWRRIDNDWLCSAGSLALRLNSHINNTSLALAMESEATGKVLLFPGDAEYGSWESWHEIEKWKSRGKDGKHLAEDLLNRTVFYKVGHHLSYNGTALEKGILMMESEELAAMATLDRRRIAEKWKSTMPNKYLLQELIRRCQGRVFVMDEYQLGNRPSRQLDPLTLGRKVYGEGWSEDGKSILYKQYTISL